MTRRLNSASIYDCPLYRSTSSTSAALHATFNEIKDLAYGFMERARRLRAASRLPEMRL
jgi:hypothetical protein